MKPAFRFPFALFAAAAVLVSLRPVPAQSQNPDPLLDARAYYTKYEFQIPMRDGVKLFTAVYVPKDRQQSYPILLNRTPYSVGPYGVDNYRAALGPSEHFQKDGFIFAYQDVRGRYMSEGVWEEVRAHKPVKSDKETDESSDTYDTIDWLVKNVPGNNGKVGMWGISYPGFYVAAGMIDSHPALKAASPQAPIGDYYMGDDSFHNGAFMLAANFSFYTRFVERKGDPTPPRAAAPFEWGTPDGYDFFLKMGALQNARKWLGENSYWQGNLDHTAYDDFWKSHAIVRNLKNVKAAVMTVGGLFDAEDVQGPTSVYRALKKASSSLPNMLVLGPWSHGQWSSGDGDRLGNLHFATKTAAFYRLHIEFPFFNFHLKGRGDAKLPEAYMFHTGVNEWRKHDAWPPKDAEKRTLYFRESARLGWDAPSGEPGSDEYPSDPNRPVPYLGYTAQAMNRDYMTEDQRFAAQRPDVLVYQTEPLAEDLSVVGPISVALHVSTTGTDSDFVVKLIDVYPGEFPGFPSAPPSASPAPPAPPNAVKMGGYQQLVRGEPFRGKYRKSFEAPEPFVPGEPAAIEFSMPDVAHTFRRGHRVMVQVQSSWFPLVDRNPQTFGDIPNARPEDFKKALQRVYRSPERPSAIGLFVVREPR